MKTSTNSLLFLIYINDISNCMDPDSFNKLFADDAYRFSSTVQELK